MCGRIDAQRLTIIDALHLNEELDYRNKRPLVIVEKNINYNWKKEEIHDKIIKTYDQSGLLLTFEFYGDAVNLFSRISYVNDTLNRLKVLRVVEVLRKDGYYKETSIYSYDIRNFLQKISDLDSNGNVIRKSKLICNEKGHPVELSLFDKMDKLIAKEKAEYIYNRNKVIRSLELNERPVIGAIDSSKISITNESKYLFDDEVFNNMGDKINWMGDYIFEGKRYYEREYTYDNFGNWVESKIYRITVDKNRELYKELKSIITRQFTYQ